MCPPILDTVVGSTKTVSIHVILNIEGVDEGFGGKL